MQSILPEQRPWEKHKEERDAHEDIYCHVSDQIQMIRVDGAVKNINNSPYRSQGVINTKFNESSIHNLECDMRPISLLQVSATKMWVLQALAIMLSIQAGTLDLVETPPVVNTLPVALPAPLNLPVGLPSSPVLKGPPNSQVLPPKRPVPPSRGGKCVPAARYFLSSNKLHECK